jgi:hypothetical protein
MSLESEQVSLGSYKPWVGRIFESLSFNIPKDANVFYKYISYKFNL